MEPPAQRSFFLGSVSGRVGSLGSLTSGHWPLDWGFSGSALRATKAMRKASTRDHWSAVVGAAVSHTSTCPSGVAVVSLPYSACSMTMPSAMTLVAPPLMALVATSCAVVGSTAYVVATGAEPRLISRPPVWEVLSQA